MAQIPSDLSNKLEFTFESDAAASFLVIKCDATVLEYQALMLEHNRIRHVIPVDVVRMEGISCLYYNITSKISLSFFLKRRKFNREEFLKLLLNITRSVNDSAGYLLTDSNFMFNPEYIYICPETLEPALIYVPVSLDTGCGAALPGFISDLLLQHINIEGFGSGNVVQRILAAVKSEMFNMKALIMLLNELLYGQVPYEDAAASAEREADERQGGMVLSGDKKNEGQAKKIREGNTDAGEKVPWIPVLAVLVQIVMGGAVYLSRGFLNNVSENPTATYAAVVMIVLALEVLLFKKLSAAKLINMEPGQKSRNSDEQKDLAGQMAIIDRKSAEEQNGDDSQNAAASAGNTLEQLYINPAMAVHDAASEAAATVAHPINSASGKTELLGSYIKGVRLLKSTGRQNGEEDILIDKDDFIIGRLAGHVDHVLKNNAVGKLHAQLICRNGACCIKDLNSVNGTFINNKRIESNKEFELKENDRLLLANSEYVFIGS